MTFRFIHTADWQVAKSFANFPPELAGELAAARLAAIPRIAAIARETGAANVLVAGDVFDSDGVSSLVIRRTLEHLNRESGITWLLLPGNHDPARLGGLWERISRIGLPSNVIACTEPVPITLEREAVLLPAPLTSKAPGRDPTVWMDHASTPNAAARIGLAHGSIHGFGSEGESSVAIARDRARSAGLDYLALGDWHGTREIDARTWYSGTPEPDRFPDNEPGHVLAVTVDGKAPPRVERVRSAHFTWAKVEAAVRSAGDLAAIEQHILSLAGTPHQLLVRLTLSGALNIASMLSYHAWRDALEGRVRHLDFSDRGLLAAADVDDLDSLGADGALRAAAERLAAMAADTGNPAHAVAGLALQRLLSFAAEGSEAAR